ncbi:copper-binding protein [Klebsiella pneumoniae subsp. rhinoscleromatis]|nr:copper-binding protein [Klebsiella pneumoniae subsp. rhinoscleromatis]
MNSLSKIALFTLLSGAVFAAQAAAPHAGMVMHEQPAAAQAQSISGKGVIKAIDMDNKKITIAHEAIPSGELAADDHALHHHPADAAQQCEGWRQRGLNLRSAGQPVAAAGYPRPITARRR